MAPRPVTADRPFPRGGLAPALGPEGEHLLALARLTDGVTERPLLGGNRLAPLEGGDEAYPRMLQAIEAARRTVSLSTFIFDRDRCGVRFAEALGRAVGRGVEVRVLVDAMGARYSWPSVLRDLRRLHVPYARFLPTLLGPGLHYSNLRNHRKILIVDGRLGFTGGMNLREGHELRLAPRHPIRDLHFEVTGPVVGEMQSAFAEDWAFSAREVLEGETWFPPAPPDGPTWARGIADGPDETFGKLRNVYLGAIACARRSLRIVTPYFLPDSAILTSLVVAAMRGIEVEIFLPARNNLKLVQWASTAILWQVLEGGCRVRLTPPPFDHTKFMVVDGAWTLVGSSNWDARSLRLNFEFDVECYDPSFARAMEARLEWRRREGREVTLAEVDSRGLPIRLRDGVARLFSPYL